MQTPISLHIKTLL